MWSFLSSVLWPFSYLYVVAPVWWRNHIEVKLIARPKNPLKVITNQNIGNFKSGLPNRNMFIRFKNKLWGTETQLIDNKACQLSLP